MSDLEEYDPKTGFGDVIYREETEYDREKYAHEVFREKSNRIAFWLYLLINGIILLVAAVR